MCRLFLSALATDKLSLAGLPDEERPRDTHVTLRCPAEGELRVYEHVDGVPLRTGNLWWFNEDMKLGRKQGEFHESNVKYSRLINCLCRSFGEQGPGQSVRVSAGQVLDNDV
jgi:hypothetical protein